MKRKELITAIKAANTPAIEAILREAEIQKWTNGFQSMYKAMAAGTYKDYTLDSIEESDLEELIAAVEVIGKTQNYKATSTKILHLIIAVWTYMETHKETV